MQARDDLFWVGREPKALEGLETEAGPSGAFDTRHLIYGPEIKGLTVRALGPEGLAQSGFDRGRRPAEVIHALPALWSDKTLIACRPLAFGPAYMHENRSPLTGAGGFASFFD